MSRIENFPIDPDVKPGLYRHYKNKEYRVFSCATHTETEEKFVVYQNLYGDFQMWVRPKAMFLEEVEIEGKKIPRFQWIAE